MTPLSRAPFLVILLACACSKPKVAVYDAPKEQAPALTQPTASQGHEGHQHDLPIAWNVPAGWTQQPGSDMRVATLLPPAAAGKAELSIIQLSGDAGGDLANVNRWRGQLGLEPVSSLAGQADSVSTPAGKTLVVDLRAQRTKRCSPPSCRTATPAGSSLAGPAAAVAGLKPDFKTFLRSLRHGGS